MFLPRPHLYIVKEFPYGWGHHPQYQAYAYWKYSHTGYGDVGIDQRENEASIPDALAEERES